MNNKKSNYNQRLFKSRIRKWLHLSRFNFVKKTLSKKGKNSLRIVELGCFDGKVLDFIPKSKIFNYIGYDADWEGGLSSAKNKSLGENIEFRFCKTASDFCPPEGFNCFLSLETMEHIEEKLLNEYLQKVEKLIDKDGIIIITVPNEIGIIFLLKYLYKSLFHGKGYEYSFSEIIWQTLGFTEKVKRNQHKGFSYIKLKKLLEKYFNVQLVQGTPLSYFPNLLNFSIAFICRPKLNSSLIDN